MDLDAQFKFVVNLGAFGVVVGHIVCPIQFKCFGLEFFFADDDIGVAIRYAISEGGRW